MTSDVHTAGNRLGKVGNGVRPAGIRWWTGGRFSPFKAETLRSPATAKPAYCSYRVQRWLTMLDWSGPLWRPHKSHHRCRRQRLHPPLHLPQYRPLLEARPLLAEARRLSVPLISL